MGGDPAGAPRALAAEEAPAEEAAEVWVRWAVLRLTLLLMVLVSFFWGPRFLRHPSDTRDL